LSPEPSPLGGRTSTSSLTFDIVSPSLLMES
jgi:hypothetical protein